MAIQILVPKVANTIDHTKYIDYTAGEPASTTKLLMELQMPHNSIGVVNYISNYTSSIEGFLIWCEVEGTRVPDSLMVRDDRSNFSKEDENIYLNYTVFSNDIIKVYMQNLDNIKGDIKAIGRIVMWYIDYKRLEEFKDMPELNPFYRLHEYIKDIVD